MQETFQSIAEFIKIREHCVFCSSKLKPVLTNFILGVSIPIINAKVLNNKFSFNLLCTKESFSISVNVTIDIHTNILQFSILDIEEYELAKTVFADYKPHVKLYCPSKKCKMKYNISSDVFRYDYTSEPSQLKVRPFMLYMESFVLDRLWIQNDWINNYMNIYSQVHFNAAPIRADLLDLEEMGKEKIINRVRTLVTFS